MVTKVKFEHLKRYTVEFYGKGTQLCLRSVFHVPPFALALLLFLVRYHHPLSVEECIMCLASAACRHMGAARHLLNQNKDAIIKTLLHGATSSQNLQCTRVATNNYFHYEIMY